MIKSDEISHKDTKPQRVHKNTAKTSFGFLVFFVSWWLCVMYGFFTPLLKGVEKRRDVNLTETLVGLAIALFGPMILAIASERFISPQSPFVLEILAMGVYLAIVAGVLFIVFHCERQSLLSIGIRPFRWQTVMWGFVLAAFFMYVFAPVAYWALARFKLGGFESGLAKSAALPVWYLVFTVVFGGISEELLYRGYAIERIAVLTGSYWLAGAVSVVIFGLAHVPLWGWGPALTTIVSGAVAAAFYICQRDLAAIIIAHVITDFAGIVVPRLARTKGL